MQRQLFLSAFIVSIVCLAGVSAAQEKKPPKITYEEHIKPILRQKCFSCHNPDKKKGDLDMTNYTNLMLGGGSGAVIEIGKSSDSYLYQLVTHEDEPFMPPESPKLPTEMLEVFRKWIDGGALENASSTAPVVARPKFDLALSDAPTERPKVAPVPPRLSLEPVVTTQKTTAISAIATSPWSPIAAIASQKQILLYNTQTLQLVGVLPYAEGIPNVLKFSRNGGLLLAGGGRGGASGKVIVWNVKTGDRIFEIGDELDAVLAADISSDQTLIALGGPQRVVRIYSTETGQLIHELRKHTDWIYSVEFSPDSVLLATGDRQGGLYVWEGWTGREYLTLKAHSAGVTGVSWRSDSNVVASCSEDGSIRLWEMENGGQIKSWTGHGGGVASIEFARDGRIVSCGRDKIAKMWDQNGGQQRAFEAFPELALQVSICDETNRVIAGDFTGAVRIWNAADGARLAEVSVNPPKLAERLTAATQQLAAKQAAHKPLADAYQAALAAATKMKADLAAAQAAGTTAQQQVTAATPKVPAAKQAVTTATTAHQQAVTAAQTLTTAVPTLTEASAKAQAASASAPADAELKDLAAKFKALTDKRTADLKVQQEKVKQAATAIESAKQQVVVAEKALADATAALTASQEQVKKLTPLVKPAEEKAAAAKAAADTAAAAVAAAQQEVNRWQAEIAFVAKLKELDTKRAAALKQLGDLSAKHQETLNAVAAAQAVVNKAATELASAQAAVTAAEQQVLTYPAKIEAAKKTQQDAVAARTGVAANVTKLESVSAALTESVAKAQDAATKSGNEKALVDIVAQIKAVAATKTQQLTAAKQDLAAKTTAVQAADAQIVELQKQATATATAAQTAKTRVTQLTAAAKPDQDKLTAAKAAAATAAKAVADGQTVVKQVDAEIAALKGI